jgi:hypothetical protein
MVRYARAFENRLEHRFSLVARRRRFFEGAVFATATPPKRGAEGPGPPCGPPHEGRPKCRVWSQRSDGRAAGGDEALVGAARLHRREAVGEVVAALPETLGIRRGRGRREPRMQPNGRT